MSSKSATTDHSWALALLGAGSLGGIFLAAIACNSILGISAATVDDGGTVITDAQTTGSCADYCATIFAHCTGNYAEYIGDPPSLSICEQMCANAAWETGTPGDKTSDSFACRLTHAVLAKDDPAAHCQAAGPTGGGICGDVCSGFCEQNEPFCGDYSFDGGTTECNAACQSFIYNTGPDAGDISDEDHNTLNCRIYHLENAYRSEPNRELHCPHTIVQSTVCVDDAG